MMTFDEQWEAHKSDGGKYQALLGEFVRREKPNEMVETGGGYSSLFTLKAMDQNGFGRLVTIDPDTQVKFTHPRFKWLKGLSVNLMADLYQSTGPWNAFLHDSDHELECQTFEYECAFGMLHPGGWIISDDYEWGTPIHYAWQCFLARHSMSAEKMGSAMIAQKPHYVPAIAKEDAHAFAKCCLRYAHSVMREWKREPQYQLQ